MSALRGLPAISVLVLIFAPVTGWAFPSDLVRAFNADHPELAFRDPPEIVPLLPEVVAHGAREESRVALTFDACSRWSGNRLNEELLALLREKQMPATLFLGGRWMYEHPELTRELHADPQFELGNHAHAHPDLTELETDDIRVQIAYAQLMALTLTGELPRFFRPPYVRYDERVLAVAAEFGARTIQYDVASGDADADADADAVARHVLDSVEPGSIVVLHLHNPDLVTARALPKILDGLAERGLEPVTVGDLLDAN